MDKIKREKVEVNNKAYKLEKFLGEDQTGRSYLFVNGEEKVVYKELDRANLDHELYSYERLSALGVDIPKLLDKNLQEGYLIKEYIIGQDATKYIAKEVLPEEMLLKLFHLAEHLNCDNLDINYFPSNFVIRDEKLVYIYYDVQPYNEVHTLRNNGIYYWINSIGMKKYVEDKNTHYLVKDGRAIRNDALKGRRDEIFRSYISWKHGN